MGAHGDVTMMKEVGARKGGFARERRKARALSKDRGITLMQAQDLVARERGYAHWSEMLASAIASPKAVTGDDPSMWSPALELLAAPYLPPPGPERAAHLLAVASIVCSGMRGGADRESALPITLILTFLMARVATDDPSGLRMLRVGDLRAELGRRISEATTASEVSPEKEPKEILIDTLRHDLSKIGCAEPARGLLGSTALTVVGGMMWFGAEAIIPNDFGSGIGSHPRWMWRKGLSHAAKGEVLHRSIVVCSPSSSDVRLLGPMLNAARSDGSASASDVFARASSFFTGALSIELNDMAISGLEMDDVHALADVLGTVAGHSPGFVDELFPVACRISGNGHDVLLIDWIVDACRKMDAGRSPFRYDPIQGGNLGREETERTVRTLVMARGAEDSAVGVIMDLIDVVRAAATSLRDVSEIAGGSYERSGRRLVLPVIHEVVSRNIDDPGQIAFYARLNRLKDATGHVLTPSTDIDAWWQARRALSFMGRPAFAAALG